jgi:hypothetical protein
MTEEIKEKIRKLLALAGSDNPYEARLAAERAVEMMNRYDLSEGDLKSEPYIKIEKANPYIRSPKWLKMLWAVVSECSGCVLIHRHKSGESGTFVVYGKRRDAKNALFLFDCLRLEIEAKAKLPVKGKSGYLFGFVVGIGRALKKAQKEFFAHSDNDKALVPVDLRAQEAHRAYRESVDKDIEIELIRPSKSESYCRGLEDGSRIKLRKGINDSGATSASLLDRPITAFEGIETTG